MLIVSGSITARPETLDALRAAGLAHSRRSRSEPGCLSHTLYVDAENPMRLFFYEEWADRAALDAHFADPDALAFMRTARDLAAASSKMKILPIVERG